ncbi:MAG: hypothetical protein JWM99_1225 [Verrucomicrobiales bacterium]|jgi:type VI secretion system secreted protein Hcp|nr:hypothetical protein [Verrucomicrobiales bacterium]
MAVDMFLKIAGIPGESTDADHKDWIQISSFSFGLSNPGSAGVGRGAAVGRPTHQDLSFIHFTDKASPLLMSACSKGKHIPEATIAVRKAGGNQQDYLQYKLTDVLISSYQTGGSNGGDRPGEEVALNFIKFEMQFVSDSGDVQNAGCSSKIQNP